SFTYQILQQQLVYNINHCGNINFIEYHATPKNTIIQLCKQFLEESLCTVIKNDIGITNLILHKVTEVNNKEIDELNHWNGDNMQINESNVILKILTSPGVTDIQAWPFNFFKTGLLNDKELTVTNCLAVADYAWLNKMLISRKSGDILNLLNSVESRRVCILIQTPIFNYCEK
ncbi:uncharacterized protein LOC143352212, partial [Halictus rubicundus]|uniref:uncharacterized protein LOC143352212 n=1 Tax=Halictus rubicundus TaxID=77578 RepID=UPI0040351DAA